MPLTKFQNDGVGNLYRRLFLDNNQNDKKPKALLADEVGMGKTVTAAGLIAKFASESNKPIRVAYICNNLALINENIEKLEPVDTI